MIFENIDIVYNIVKNFEIIEIYNSVLINKTFNKVFKFPDIIKKVNEDYAANIIQYYTRMFIEKERFIYKLEPNGNITKMIELIYNEKYKIDKYYRSQDGHIYQTLEVMHGSFSLISMLQTEIDYNDTPSKEEVLNFYKAIMFFIT